MKELDQKDKIIEAIKAIGNKLRGQDISWLIGGSGSLLIHGIEVVPDDIDLVVDPKDYDEAKMTLKDIITVGLEDDEDTIKTSFKIGSIRGELLALNVDRNKLTKIDVGGVGIFVHQLQAEYEFYKNRTDKIEANRKRIELIKNALSNAKNKTR